MKQVILAVVLAFTLQANAQDEIKKELEPICATFDSTYTLEGWKAKSDQLALVKGKYPENWMPAYYYAYSCIQMSYFEPTLAIKDALVDNAEEQMAKIETCPLTDEVHIMKALIANARIGADPENRWQKYGKIFDENLKSAKAINENNPHIYLLKGISTFYTPKMFGGGAKNAKTYFEKAKVKYDLVTSTDVDKPYWWGRSTCIYFFGEIEKELNK
ncbi:MAG: hypothetical protein K0S23_3101 [Fluviicola sp.]|jgi:hypothetical protein|uniref:hypothetical protein n=1 Tax=Fluviicola sp. TaxID=1917219 RepID=UPI002602171B|nr:hypothetical protein [Fluviicola sp.]MDF3028794.1 hypothetical protein [Fluviicola sp.]